MCSLLKNQSVVDETFSGLTLLWLHNFFLILSLSLRIQVCLSQPVIFKLEIIKNTTAIWFPAQPCDLSKKTEIHLVDYFQKLLFGLYCCFVFFEYSVQKFKQFNLLFCLVYLLFQLQLLKYYLRFNCCLFYKIALFYTKSKQTKLKRGNMIKCILNQYQIIKKCKKKYYIYILVNEKYLSEIIILNFSLILIRGLNIKF